MMLLNCITKYCKVFLTSFITLTDINRVDEISETPHSTVCLQRNTDIITSVKVGVCAGLFYQTALVLRGSYKLAQCVIIT